MEVGKRSAGLIGQTTDSRSVIIWANNHHLCSEMLAELGSLRNRDKKEENKHKKKEGKGRLSKTWKIERLSALLQNCINPLKGENILQ